MNVQGFVSTRGFKLGLFVLCLFPLARLVTLGVTGGLGANPIEFITRSTGTWTLVGLLLTGWAALVRHRRMLGLFAFFYASLHFVTYIWLDQFFDLASVARDIVKRPFITVGFAAFVLLIPLALTSTQAMMRRLGRRWQQLHRLVYGIAILGVLHYLWLVKQDLGQPLIYGGVLALLLGARLPRVAGLLQGMAPRRVASRSG
jgi:sulfoxide reductase heme-binding subunit YedZ